MADINLLKNELTTGGAGGGVSFGRKGLKAFYVLLLVIIIEIVLYAGMLIFQKRIDQNILGSEQALAEIDFDIQNTEDQRTEAVLAQKRLSNLSILLDAHLYWTQFFSELEGVTLTQAQISSLQVGFNESKLVLAGVVPDYTQLAKFLTGLERSEYVRQVDLESSGSSDSEIAGVSFNVEVIFDNKILERNK